MVSSADISLYLTLNDILTFYTLYLQDIKTVSTLDTAGYPKTGYVWPLQGSADMPAMGGAGGLELHYYSVPWLVFMGCQDWNITVH